jgi:WD40 repeat protein
MVAAWSPDWQLIACANSRVLQVWERSTGRILLESAVPGSGAGIGILPVKRSVQWSSDGKYFATAIDFDPISAFTQVWVTSTGKINFSRPLNAIAWSPDGKRLALRQFPSALGSSRTDAPVEVQIWDVVTQDLITSYMVPASAYLSSFWWVDPNRSFLWSPDGKYMVSESGDVWNATTGAHVATYQSSRSWSMVWSPNSQYLAAFDASQYKPQDINQQLNIKVDPTVHVWNILTGEDLFVYRGHTAGVNDVAWSPDSTRIASASADNTVKVWQAVTM